VSKGWPTNQIRAALRKRHEPPAWAFLEEVAEGTGGDAGRYADAVAMSLWPSRGLVIHGFEIKATRSDWLKELRDAEKAEAIQRYCDYWWVVVGLASIVKASELPENWGLVVPSGTGLRVKVDAPKLEPVDVDRPFLAALLRRASELPQNEISKARREGYQEGEERVKEWAERDLVTLRERVATFEAAAGVEVAGWNAARVGEAVRFVLDGKHLQLEGTMRAIRLRAQRVIEAVDAEAVHDVKEVD